MTMNLTPARPSTHDAVRAVIAEQLNIICAMYQLDRPGELVAAGRYADATHTLIAASKVPGWHPKNHGTCIVAAQAARAIHISITGNPTMGLWWAACDLSCLNIHPVLSAAMDFDQDPCKFGFRDMSDDRLTEFAADRYESMEEAVYSWAMLPNVEARRHTFQLIQKGTPWRDALNSGHVFGAAMVQIRVQESLSRSSSRGSPTHLCDSRRARP